MRAAAMVLVMLAQAASQPVFKSGVNLVEVDVVVTDKAGQPVRGLREVHNNMFVLNFQVQY